MLCLYDEEQTPVRVNIFIFATAGIILEAKPFNETWH